MVAKRQHRRKASEDLVAIQAERVAAALERRALSVNGAAKALNTRQQTLDTIVRGRTKRCYQSMREKLAGLVDVPGEWLGGEMDLLPSLAPWWPDRVGFPRALVFPSVGVPGPDLLENTTTLHPRHQLSAHALSTKITLAWKRDIEKNVSAATSALERVSSGRWKARPWECVSMLVTRLLSAYWWRQRFLFPPPFIAWVNPTAPVALPDPRFSPSEWQAIGEGFRARLRQLVMERWEAGGHFAVNTAAAWDALLGPWFAGSLDLSYDGLLDSLGLSPEEQ